MSGITPIRVYTDDVSTIIEHIESLMADSSVQIPDDVTRSTIQIREFLSSADREYMDAPKGDVDTIKQYLTNENPPQEVQTAIQSFEF